MALKSRRHCEGSCSAEPPTRPNTPSAAWLDIEEPEIAPKSTLQEEGNLCPQSGLSRPGVNMNVPWWEGAGAPHPSQHNTAP